MGHDAIVRLLAVVIVSVVLGALTSVGQQHLPEQLTSFANSAGSWTLVAFGLSLLARRWWSGWLFALAAFVSLLAGYTVASEIRGYATSTSMWVLWGTAAIVVAPVLGIMGAWARRDSGVGRSVTTGALSGLLVGEGAYGLTVVADTTSPVYWTISTSWGWSVWCGSGACADRWPRRRLPPSSPLWLVRPSSAPTSWCASCSPAEHKHWSAAAS